MREKSLVECTGSEMDASLAYLFLRATLGVNILIHGASRLLSGPEKFAALLAQQFDATPLPHLLITGFAYCLPWIEAITGAFILVGLFSRIALSVGALLIFVLSFGSTLRQDWESAGLQLIYAATYAALLLALHNNRYSVDALLCPQKSRLN